MELCQGYLKATKVSMLPRIDVARAQEINQLPKRPASVDDKLPMLETRSQHEVNTSRHQSPGSNRGVCFGPSMTSHIVATARRVSGCEVFFSISLWDEDYERSDLFGYGTCSRACTRDLVLCSGL